MKLSRRTSWYTRSTSRSAPARIPLGGRHPLVGSYGGSHLLANSLLPAGQILGALAQYHLPGCDLRLLLEPPLPLLKPGLLLSETTLTFLQLCEAGGEVLFAGRDGAQLLLQVPLLRHHGLLMTGGVDQG